MLGSDAEWNGKKDVKESAKCDIIEKESINLPEGILSESAKCENRAENAVSYQFIVGQNSTKDDDRYQCSTTCVCVKVSMCSQKVLLQKLSVGRVWLMKVIQKLMLRRLPINRIGNMRHVRVLC